MTDITAPRNNFVKSITFPTQAQAALFKCELQGQCSDGHWENSRRNWRVVCNADVLVHPKHIGKEFIELYDKFRGEFKIPKYNFNDPDLVNVVGGRMLAIAKLANAGYTLSEVKLIEDYILAWVNSEDPKTPSPYEGIRQYVFECAEKEASGERTGSYYTTTLQKLKLLDDKAKITEALNADGYGFKELRNDLKAITKLWGEK